MTREPAWKIRNRRRSWERDQPLRFSDFDPAAPVLQALNRVRLGIDARTQRIAAAIDRLDDARREARRKP